MTEEDPLVAEALRVNARYVEEVVIGWGLCPWAAQAWRDGAVARRVLPEAAVDQAGVLTFLDEIAVDPSTSIGLLIFPRVLLDEAAWGAFAERIRRADRARRPDAAPPFLIAAFHPAPEETAADAANPAALVSYLRRAPDPVLQLVRASLLERLSEGGRDLSGEIARANFATVGDRTPAALDAVVRDIRRDRDAAYARL